MWTDAELIDYINDARKRTCVDTHCLRSLETATLVTNTETYSVATLTTKTTRCFDIKAITVLWGSQRVPLLWCSWSKFNALFRTWQSNLGRPSVWSFQGVSPVSSKIYIQPVPDQNYSAEVDIFYTPEDLVDNTTIDEIGYPFTAPVAYYAAHKAKEQEQSYGEAQALLEQYAKKAMESINSFTARIPDQYS